MDSLKETKKESVLISNNKSYEQHKTFLLVGDKFIFGMHLKQPEFTYSGFRSRIQKFKQTGGSKYIC